MERRLREFYVLSPEPPHFLKRETWCRTCRNALVPNRTDVVRSTPKEEALPSEE